MVDGTMPGLAGFNYPGDWRFRKSVINPQLVTKGTTFAAILSHVTTEGNELVAYIREKWANADEIYNLSEAIRSVSPSFVQKVYIKICAKIKFCRQGMAIPPITRE